MGKNIRSLEVSSTTISILKEEGIHYVYELFNKSINDLLKIPGMGKKRIIELQKAMLIDFSNGLVSFDVDNQQKTSQVAELSIRDQFAMEAMREYPYEWVDENGVRPDKIAKNAYLIADAMMAERNKS